MAYNVNDDLDLTVSQNSNSIIRAINILASQVKLLSGKTSWKTPPSTSIEVISNSASGNANVLSNIVYKDANWDLCTRVNQYVARETLVWTSFGVDGSGADTQTGNIKIGYLTLRNKLHLYIAGGGSTSPTAKTLAFIRKSDNSVLMTRHMGQIIGIDTNGLIHAQVDTSSIFGETVYLSFTDNATDAYGWIAFSPNVFIE